MTYFFVNLIDLKIFESVSGEKYFCYLILKATVIIARFLN